MNKQDASKPEGTMCAGMMGQEEEDGKSGATCPMASMFKGIMQKARFAYFIMVPGLALVLLGLLILIEPRVLFWLVAAVSILLGILVFTLAILLRRLHRRFSSILSAP